MKERISCFDIDGTLSRGMLFVPLIKSEHENGHLDDLAFEKILVLLSDYKTGKLEYEPAVEALLQAHAAGIRGKTVRELGAHAEEFLSSNEAALFRVFGRSAVELLKIERRLCVVTAEPQYIAEAVANIYDMDVYLSSVYSQHDGMFTGDVVRSLAYRAAKLEALSEYEIEFAFGDSEGDIDMLARAEHPYCISPTEGLSVVAKDRNWKVFDGEDTDRIIASVKESIS